MYLLILYLPLISCFISGFFGRFLTPKGVAFFSTICILVSFVFSLFSFFEVGFCSCFCYLKLFTWIDCFFLMRVGVLFLIV